LRLTNFRKGKRKTDCGESVVMRLLTFLCLLNFWFIFGALLWVAP